VDIYGNWPKTTFTTKNKTINRIKVDPCDGDSYGRPSVFFLVLFGCLFFLNFTEPLDHKLNSIQDYLYSAFHDTIVAKQLYRKLSFYNRFIYCRNLIYLTSDKIWLIL